MKKRPIFIEIFEVGFALTLGLWIPLRLLYFPDLYWVDITMESIGFLYWALEIRLTGWRKRRLLGLAWALPIYTISEMAPMDLVFPATYLLILKFTFVPRILTIRQVLERFDSLHPIAYRLISIGTTLPVIIHVQACIWIALGSGTAGPGPDPVSEYVKALYWTITTLTTIGYGDISAKTNIQMVYSCLAEVVGVGFFGYVLSNVASLLARMDAAREHHLSTLDQVESFIKYNNLPPEFRTKMRGYYRYLWENHRGFDDKSILDQLPRALRSEATFLMNKDIVPKVPFLKNAPQDLLEDIVFQLKPLIAMPNEHLFYRGEVGDTMYFIQHGQIDILAPDNSVIVTLHDGAFFGEMSLLLDAPRSATAKARTYCDLFTLEKSAFEQVISKHPNFRSILEEVVAARTKKAA